MLLGGVQAINARVDRYVPLWPAVAEFDLAALSIARNQVLLPSYSVGDGMDVADLEQAFQTLGGQRTACEYAARHTRSVHAQLDGCGTDRTAASLARRSRRHPIDYLAHRLVVSAALFGTHRREWPRELTFADAEVSYRDNPPVAPNTSALHRALMQRAETSVTRLY